ncbi:Saccharolysin [Pseudocercospora fuligena]|uniref:Saccharolysin n=1 Tax=Pseudocercospora fuligena TaxID=685502 RepID=A0A8H6RAM4_9PEZI|nr:Saccharolysin [Pseudocercospora fuligena]
MPMSISSSLPLYHLHGHEKPRSPRGVVLGLLLCLAAVVYLLRITVDGDVFTDRNGHALFSRDSYGEEKLSSGIRKPPQAPIAFTDTPESIIRAGEEVASEEQKVVDRIVKSVKIADASFANTLLPYLHHEASAAIKLASGVVYPSLRGDKQDLVNASQTSSDGLGKVGQATFSNTDFFNLTVAVYEKQANDTKLPLETRRIIQSFPASFTLYGIELASDKLKRFQTINSRIQDLSQEFLQEAIADNPSLFFTPEELNGTQPDKMSSLPKGKDKNEGKVEVKMQVIPLQNPDLGAIINHCTNATTRQKLVTTQANLAAENVARLEEVIELREEIAGLLGFQDYATYRIQSNMAGTPKAVNDFISDVRAKISQTAIRSTAHFKELKRKDVGKADHLWPWDASYYYRKSNEEEYNIDSDKIKEWFPAIHTLQVVLDLYSTLFGLDFVKIEGKDRDQLAKSGKGSDLVWHPDVELYGVWDKTDGRGFIGYLYLDVYYREGKRGNAFMLPLAPGFTKEDGTRYYPSAVLVTNFKKTESDTPSLLYRSEVQTLLHEAGHGMHHLTSMTKFSRLHGPGGCPIDFVEAPSQMMENFAYSPPVLKMLSKHWSYLSPEFDTAWKKSHKDKPPEKLPDNVIDNILRNKDAYNAYTNLYQVFYASWDMKIHETKSPKAAKDIDTTAEWNRIYTDYVKGIDTPSPAWGHLQSTFTYPMAGYDAGYYAYLWSKSYAEDVFYTAFKNNPISSETGIRWRRTVLQPGGAKDYDSMLTEFLGRESNRNAFFEDLGVKV